MAVIEIDVRLGFEELAALSLGQVAAMRCKDEFGNEYVVRMQKLVGK